LHTTSKLLTFASDMKQEKKHKGGRPHTGRDNRQTIKLSDEAIALLNAQSNKSAFIDALIRGDVVKIKCPNCGHQITVRTED
jgi:hypothetical protein